MAVKIVVPVSDLYDFDPIEKLVDDAIIKDASDFVMRFYLDGDAENWLRNAVYIRNQYEDGPGYDRVEFDLVPCVQAF